jgi:hypothetical protein
VVELRGATEKLSIAQIEGEIKKTKRKKWPNPLPIAVLFVV